MEGFFVVPSRTYQYPELLPVPVEEEEGPGIHAISLQDLQAPGTVQGVVHLVQFQEDQVKDLPHHGNELMKQFDLKGGGPRTATHTGPIKGVVVGDEGGESATGSVCKLLHIFR